MDSQLTQFIKEYLYESFSIDKIKDRKNRKFKRGVVLDMGYVMYVSDYGRIRIREQVFEHLKDIFNVDDAIITEVMSDYLTETKGSKKKLRPTKKRPSQIVR